MSDSESKNLIRKAQLRKAEPLTAEEELPAPEEAVVQPLQEAEQEKLILRPLRIALQTDETEVLSAEEDFAPEPDRTDLPAAISEVDPAEEKLAEIMPAQADIEVGQSGRSLPEIKYVIPDIPLRFSSFDEVMESVRDLHPSPEELLMDQTAVQRTWLLSQLKRARTESEIETLAYSLDFKDLSVLFPVLSTLKKREDVNQIQNLIRLRASHYLYICGWLTFQFSYPRSNVARVLADLCMILEDVSFLREELSRKEQEQLFEYKVPDLGPDRILWNEVEMISGISLPNSRRFVSEIANELYKSNIDEDIFLKRYAIYPNLALGKAILEKYEEMASGMEVNPMLSKAFLDRFKRDD
ncbi:MAG: hypothetical protein GX034_04755 [Clostridiaceae bacterium]|jgi:hypothetical protein|nr:hypothetical protein [Clostridiaceae bacterium]